MKSPWAPSMRGSSSRGISGSPAPGRRSRTSRSGSGTSTRGRSRCSPGMPGTRQLMLSESISGDTAVGHSNACVRLLETVLGTPAHPAAETWRSVALELERIANHVGDLGGLSGRHRVPLRVGALRPPARDGPRLPHGAHGQPVRPRSEPHWRSRPARPGDRVPRGVLDRLRGLRADVERTGTIMLESPSVVVRMEGTGRLPLQTARTLGIVGVAARASGRDIDARRDFPSPCFSEFPPDGRPAERG